MASIARKPSPLKPRYRVYSVRKWREVSHTLDVLTEVRERLQSEGEMVAGVKVTRMIDSVLRAQRRMLGAKF
ncbi:MAG TPA: hypothetical protein VF914_22545 [Chloroflexia bacterium]